MTTGTRIFDAYAVCPRMGSCPGAQSPAQVAARCTTDTYSLCPQYITPAQILERASTKPRFQIPVAEHNTTL